MSHFAGCHGGKLFAVYPQFLCRFFWVPLIPE